MTEGRKTNFDKIREEALAITEMPNCPEIVKELFVKMVADEPSLADLHKALAILSIHCSQYKDFVERVNGHVITTLVMQILNDPTDKEPN